ncbi:unnamed protein product [Coffea canephora]|uniref:Uncharacterized protein n=1 Tax=Coffea canephora TaxID=49390 RepID=A0A068U516_COFCA|nr:unnamed protein product [Coffea canephora]
MGRPRKYASLEEATRERNARRRRQRGNASANDNSGECRDTAARTRLSVPIEQPSSGPSSVELSYKGTVGINTEGINNRDGHRVGSTCLHSSGGSIHKQRQSCHHTRKPDTVHHILTTQILNTKLPTINYIRVTQIWGNLARSARLEKLVTNNDKGTVLLFYE